MQAPLGRTLGLVLCGACIIIVAKTISLTYPNTQLFQADTLKIAIRESQQVLDSLFEDNGFDRDLFEAFAQDMGYQTEYLSTESTQDSIKLLTENDVNVALGVQASLTATGSTKSRAYSKVQPLVVCRSDVDFKKLYKKGLLSVLLPQDRNLQDAILLMKQTYPKALYLTQKKLNVGDAIETMHNKSIDCTLTQERLFKINRLAYPRIRSAVIIGAPIAMSAYFNDESSIVASQFEKWLSASSTQVKLDSLKEKYFGFYEVFDAYEVEVFEKRIESRLRQYIPIFKAAQAKYGIAWELLASIAYQESHWNPHAKSFTGVKGMMMLTQSTAKEMGVTDRIDPRKSIFGGAAYLKKIMDRLPSNIPAHERIFFALASYNVGFGHVQDARSLVAVGEGESWHAIKESLPLLAKRRVYSKLRYGKARGKEPVIYVQRIRKFQKLLSLAFSSSQETVGSNAIWADNTKDTITPKNQLMN